MTEEAAPFYLNQKPLQNEGKVHLSEILTIGTEESKPDHYFFGQIIDLTIDRDNHLYVLDKGLWRVQNFSVDGKYLRSIDLAQGKGPGEFIAPRCLAVDDSSNIYITDDAKREVLCFDNKGKFLRSFKVNMRPAQMVIGKDQQIYLSGFLFSYKGPAIRSYSKNGKCLTEFCERNKYSEITMLTGNNDILAVDDDGNVYYSFQYPYEIRKFSPDGTLILKFTRKTSFFKLPVIDRERRMAHVTSASEGLGVFPDGNVVHLISAKDNKSNRVYLDLFDKHGDLLGSIPLSKYGIQSVRHFCIDHDGFLYFDKMEPYPHIVKYSLNTTNK